MATKSTDNSRPSDQDAGLLPAPNADPSADDIRRVRLLRDIAIIANERSVVSEAVAETVGLICRFADWAEGAGYIADTESGDLRLCARIRPEQNHVPSDDDLALRSMATDAINEGQPVGLDDPASDSTEKLVAFPIRVGNSTGGALVFRMRGSTTEGSALFTLMTVVGAQLGRVIERDRADRALRERERLLQEVQHIAGLGHWRFDVATGQLDWSDHLYKLYGVATDSELSYELYLSCIHPDDRARVVETIERGMEDHRPFSHVHRVVLPNGDIRVIQGNGQVDVADDGSISMWGTGLDVTHVEQIEERLRESEKRYRLLAEHATDMILASDGEGVIRYASPAAIQLVGYHPEEMIGRSGYEFLHPDEIGELGTVHQDLLKASEMMTITYRFRRKDESFAWLESTVRAFGVDGGGPIEIVSSSRDVSERIRSEAALRSSESRLRLMADTAVEAIVTIDSEGLIRGWNRSAARVFGHEFSDVEGQSLAMLMPEKYQDQHSAGLRRVVETGESKLTGQTVELEGVRSNGEVFPLELSISSWADDDEVFFAGFIRDISDRRKAKETLIKKSRQLRRLAARLERVREDERTKLSREVHDVLGQKLTALRLDLSTIESRVQPDEIIGAKMEAAKDGIADLIQLVRRIASDLRPGVLDDLGLDAALEFEAEKFQDRTGLACEFKSDLVHNHELDRDQATAMFRVYQELLTNIARHAECTTVKITLFDDDSDIVMTVSDDGVGIRMEDVDARESLGILGMRERLTPWGGDLTYEASKSGGAKALVRLPVNPSSEI